MATRCQDVAQRLSSGMAGLLNRIQALSGSGMAGSANNALQSVSVDLNSGLTTIVNALDELSGKISNTSSEFGISDEDSARRIADAAAVEAGTPLQDTLRGKV